MRTYRLDDFVPAGLEGFLPTALTLLLLAALNPIAALLAAAVWGLAMGAMIGAWIWVQVEQRAPLWPASIQIGLCVPVLILLLNFYFQWIPLR